MMIFSTKFILAQGFSLDRFDVFVGFVFCFCHCFTLGFVAAVERLDGAVACDLGKLTELKLC